MTRAIGAGMARTGAALLIVALVVGLTTCAWAKPDPRIVNPSAVDKNGDKISDSFAAKVADRSMATVQADGVTYADLIVCLDHAPNAADVGAIQSLGGNVPDSWKDLVYAIHVQIPITRDRTEQTLDLIKQRCPGVVLVEENARSQAHLYLSTQQEGARTAWAAGYAGATNISVAIMDTGITSSHADLPGPFPNKVLAWDDEVGGTLTPADFAEHGSHVAGIVAGTGASAGLAQPGSTGWVYVTHDLYFNPTANNGWMQRFPIDTRSYGGNATIRGWLKWTDNMGGAYSIGHSLYTSGSTWLAGALIANNGAQPLQTTYAALPAGQYDWRYFALPYCTVANNNNSPTWALIDAPMSAIGDGFNLMCGVAPVCKLVGVKVLDNNGSGTSNDFLDGLTWIVNNAAQYNIKVINMSMGFTSVIGSVDTAVKSAVITNNLVVVASSGNTRSWPSPTTVGSPASCSAAIAVGAISHIDKVTNYSTYGANGTSKPDVVAYGGTGVSGGDRAILSVDSSDGDRNVDYSDGSEQNYPEAWQEDDYRGMQGTSMAGPQVAGEAALVIQALGVPTPAIGIKAIIEMTCTETNQTAEVAPNPTLNRGNKDTSEGYGRVNMEAAIEMLTMAHTVGGQGDSATLAATSTDNRVFNRNCWARQVSLSKNTAYQFDLDTPAGGDFDLYLYSGLTTNDGSTSSGSIGDPIIEAKSVGAGVGVDEKINYSCCMDGIYFIIVKRVSGSGTFTLTSQSYSFSDVPPSHTFHGAIEAMLSNAITGGCAANGDCPDTYCPTSNVTRGQMSAFICKAWGKTQLANPVATFTDVPTSHLFYGWVERLVDAPSWGGVAVTGGCGGPPLIYCPTNNVTRGQMAAFLCKAAGQTWLANPTPTFGDVPTSHLFYGWIERVADAPSWPGGAVTTGCGGGNYCPTTNVTRGQMAQFLCRAAGIPF